jgi:reductive dehalogenase
MLLTSFLLVVNGIFLLGALLFAYESMRENEVRAARIGFAAVALTTATALVILLVPSLRWPIAVLFGITILLFSVFLIPSKPSSTPLKGSLGYVTGKVARYDERDMVFARNSIPLDSEIYEKYYRVHPQLEEGDAKRRSKGGTVGPRPGAIDKGHRPNLAMTKSAYCVLPTMGPQPAVTPTEGNEPYEIDPHKATEVVKGYARHLGADLVGVCRVNELWAYSHRGECHFDNWEEWGKEIPDQLPYAVVIATEMEADLVNASPHTPAHVETRLNYSQGVYITKILANWFGDLGYKAVAHNRAQYDLLMVPLAVDAGLGQLGRFGYLITHEFGARVRLFAVTTDMPLIADKPVDLGADEFCDVCKKCATTCPSHSIPLGSKEVLNGQEKWRMNGESCFEYWANVGTACAICMAICPYSRPYRSVHRLIRWMLARSNLARRVFPHVDNILYGQRWKPKPVPSWIEFRESKGNSPAPSD